MVFHLADNLGNCKTKMGLQKNMNEIIETGFSPQASRESGAKELLAQLSSGELDANGACGAQILSFQAEAATVAPEKASDTRALKQAAYEDLASGVLKQAAHDLRRFHTATKGVERDLYLDAYSWIRANDFSWPYSFVNVCKLLDVCPEVVRAEILADASSGSFSYLMKRGSRFASTLRTYLFRPFARSRNQQRADIDWPSPSLQPQ
jgi:hypothetical protein